MIPISSGCTATVKSQTTQIFAMNTFMQLTAYGEESQQAIDDGTALIYDLEDLLSVTDSESELWALNHSGGDWVTLSSETMDVLALALAMAEQTGGAIDPTIYPVLQLWGFTTGEYQVPSDDALSALLPLVDYSAVTLDRDNNRAKLPVGMELDLGAVAKGYTADRLSDLFLSLDIDHALLDLGGNVQVLGGKPDGTLWRVGIQNPDGDGYVGSVAIETGAAVTSGGYQRFFEADGIIYWHILDPDIGAPSRNSLRSVTVISPSGGQSDALSTALFVLGREGAEALWRAHQDFDMILIEENGTITITAGLLDVFVPIQSEQEATVEVIAP